MPGVTSQQALQPAQGRMSRAVMTRHASALPRSVIVCLAQSALPCMQLWHSPQASGLSKTTVSRSPSTLVTIPLLVMLPLL